MKIGDVILNLYASETNPVRMSVLTYMGVEKCNTLYPYKGKIRKSQYYTKDFIHDSEHFKVVGHIDLYKLLKDELDKIK